MTRLSVGLLVSAAAACSGHGADQGPSTGLDPDASTAAVDAASGEGTAILFDNAGSTFEWTPTSYAPCCGSEPGLHLDLTLEAGSQSGEPSPSAIEFFISWDELNITPGGFYFRSSGDADTPEGIFIAEGDAVFLEGGEIGGYTIHPPLAMSAGDTVGPDLTWRVTEHAWADGEAGPQTVHIVDPSGEYPPTYAAFTEGIIGVELPLADGIHYAFVDLAWRPGESTIDEGRHVPVRWGYQPEPDTPLVIPAQ